MFSQRRIKISLSGKESQDVRKWRSPGNAGFRQRTSF